MMSKAEGGDADAQIAPIAGGSGNAGWALERDGERGFLQEQCWMQV